MTSTLNGFNGAPHPGIGSGTGAIRPATVSAPMDVVTRLRAAVSAHLTSAGQMTDDERDQRIALLIAQELDANASADINAGRTPLPPQVEAAVARALRDSFTGLGVLQRLIDDPEVEDVFVNGCDNVWVHTIDHRTYRAAPIAATDEELIDLIQIAAARSGQEERRFDRGSPALNLRLPGGQRLFAVMAVSKRPSVTIRRHTLHQITLADLQRRGELSPGLRALLTAMVRARKNIVISGGPAAGKTTLLRAAAAEIDPVERIVTVEDAFELGLDEDTGAHPNTVAVQQREPNLEGVGGIDMATMVKWGLRMRPDRVIVGETRGAEALTMLFAMSQGNDGSMCTVHASSSRQALTRLGMYVMAAPEKLTFEAANMLIGQAVDFVVHLATATDGTRVVSSILQVLESSGDQVPANEIFRPGRDRRAIPGAPMRDDVLDDLVAAGLHPDLLIQDRW
jgi:pilus assembly protein CpaF